MNQKSIKLFINATYSKGPKGNYHTNKTDVYYNDDIWSLDILNLKDYGPENFRGYRYVLVFIDSFSKFDWTVPHKDNNAQTRKYSSEKFSITSKTKVNLIETDRRKETCKSVFEFS